MLKASVVRVNLLEALSAAAKPQACSIGVRQPGNENLLTPMARIDTGFERNVRRDANGPALDRDVTSQEYSEAPDRILQPDVDVAAMLSRNCPRER